MGEGARGPTHQAQESSELIGLPLSYRFTGGESVAWGGATSRNKSAAQLGLAPRCPDSRFEALSTTPTSLQQPPSSSLLPPLQSGPRLPPSLGTFQPILGACPQPTFHHRSFLCSFVLSLWVVPDQSFHDTKDPKREGCLEMAPSTSYPSHSPVLLFSLKSYY